MNVLITGGKNDNDFLAALVKTINKIQTDACAITCTAIGSLSQAAIMRDLEGKIGEIRRGKIRRIGILIDQDQHSHRRSLPSSSSPTSGEYVVYCFHRQGHYVEIAAHVTNVNGQGELEAVLKAIKTKPSPHADCLHVWRRCAEEEEVVITEK